MGQRRISDASAGRILRPDFWHLAELLYERGLMWCVMGNPSHLTDEVCARMKALGCRSLVVE